MAVICRQSKSEDADAQITLEVCKGVFSSLWLSTKLCMLKKKKQNLRPGKKKKSLDLFSQRIQTILRAQKRHQLEWRGFIIVGALDEVFQRDIT